MGRRRGAGVCRLLRRHRQGRETLIGLVLPSSGAGTYACKDHEGEQGGEEGDGARGERASDGAYHAHRRLRRLIPPYYQFRSEAEHELYLASTETVWDGLEDTTRRYMSWHTQNTVHTVGIHREKDARHSTTPTHRFGTHYVGSDRQLMRFESKRTPVMTKDTRETIPQEIFSKRKTYVQTARRKGTVQIYHDLCGTAHYDRAWAEQARVNASISDPPL